MRAAYAVVSPTAERTRTIVASQERVVDDEQGGAVEVARQRRKAEGNQ
jgi:hypothetical protein